MMVHRFSGRFLALCGAILFAGPVGAAESGSAVSLLESNVVGRMEIIGGLITPARFPYTYNCQRLNRKKGSADSESMSISVRKGRATVRYQGTRGKRSTTLEVLPDGVARFVESSTDQRDEHTEVEYRQTVRQVRLIVRFPDRDVHLSGRNLWELLLAHRDLTGATLVPALHRLQRRWDLDRRAVEIESRLFDVAASDWRPLDRQKLANLINDLADKKFPVRQSAHRRLLAYGQRVVPYLLQIDLPSLDREQRVRLRHIRRELVGRGADLSDRVAIWASGSRPVWISLLNNADLRRRQTAAHHLAKILGRTVTFDPAAESDIRRAQVRQLRKKYDARSIAAKRRKKKRK